jgi:hypothetical protein
MSLQRSTEKLLADRNESLLAPRLPSADHAIGVGGTGAQAHRSNTAIAGRFGLTEKAVKRHISCIYGELVLAPCREDHRRSSPLSATSPAERGRAMARGE